jgi:hypothetical protein
MVCGSIAGDVILFNYKKKNPMWIRGLDFVAASVPIPVVG